MRFFYLLLTCLCSTTFAGDINAPAEERQEFSLDSKEPLFVSLGPNCYIAIYLAQIGYRRASFPFDWLLTLDHNGMIKLLDDDFKYFLDPNYYSIHTNLHLIHTYYHIEFRHEHDNDLIGKYGRRIDRFRRLNDYAGKVFFMRQSYSGAESPSFYWLSKDLLNISFEHALELKQVLNKRFPNLDFSLVILNFHDDETTMEVMDDIMMFKVDIKADGQTILSTVVKKLLKYGEDP